MNLSHHKAAAEGRAPSEPTPAYSVCVNPEACQETPFDVLYNGRPAATLMCTPDRLKELTVGWLYTSGLIDALADISMLGVCADMRRATVAAQPDRWEHAAAARRVVTSGCGAPQVSEHFLAATGGQGAGAPAHRRRLLPGDVPVARVRRIMVAMLESARRYRSVGGTHSACLGLLNDEFGPGQRDPLLFACEDIGRHNALDKAIGWGLMNSVDFSGCVLAATGRISSEMVAKAARAGVPVVASLSVPTDLALTVAGAAGIAVVGRTLSARPAVYSIRAGNQEF